MKSIGVIMKTITVRGIDSNTANYLKQYASDHGTSVNTAIVNLLQQALGVTKQPRQKIYHDLDDLAGGWTDNDLKEFENNTSQLSEIDKELWQ